jgi:hypothetical protein
MNQARGYDAEYPTVARHIHGRMVRGGVDDTVKGI